jgi:hypothetical protein
MLTIRIVGDVALTGEELERARLAAVACLKAEGITTADGILAARNASFAREHLVMLDDGVTYTGGAWERARCAAAGALKSQGITNDQIDLLPVPR